VRAGTGIGKIAPTSSRLQPFRIIEQNVATISHRSIM
jgi:hypothetical protein